MPSARSPLPIYLWGPAGAGKTHLLRAARQALAGQGAATGWLDAQASPHAAFDAAWDVVLLDDVQRYGPELQQTAFNWFINAATPADGRPRAVLAAGRLPPADLPLREDLRTRLGWGHVFELHPLPDEQGRAALRQAAATRGLALGDEVIDYVLARFSRDLGSLMQLLDHLDRYALQTQRAITIPLIVAGITLSTMHQSTLGTMLTILPYRIHPLWYSPLMPLYFYLTAIAAGLAMTVFESYHSARTYGFPFELKLFSSLVKIIPYVLGLYLALRVGELFVTGKYMHLLEGGAPAVMWFIEIIGGVIIPLLFFADRKTREDADGIVWAAFFTMGGLILNRVNSAMIFMDGAFYMPSWSELAVTFGLTAFGVILFDAAVRFLPMFPEPKPEVVKQL